MNEITITEVENDISSCNVCYARNYDSRYSELGYKVDTLYEVKIGIQISCLCRKCLRGLICCGEYVLDSKDKEDWVIRYDVNNLPRYG